MEQQPTEKDILENFNKMNSRGGRLLARLVSTFELIGYPRAESNLGVIRKNDYDLMTENRAEAERESLFDRP